VIVLATYTNGEIAALVAPYGKGKVGVSGPHGMKPLISSIQKECMRISVMI
jgi:hypothetical protein